MTCGSFISVINYTVCAQCMYIVRIRVLYSSELTVKEVGSCRGCEKLKKNFFFFFYYVRIYGIKYYDLRTTKKVNKLLCLIEDSINFDSLLRRVFRLIRYET